MTSAPPRSGELPFDNSVAWLVVSAAVIGCLCRCQGLVEIEMQMMVLVWHGLY